jgi:hypothetical protein
MCTNKLQPIKFSCISVVLKILLMFNHCFLAFFIIISNSKQVPMCSLFIDVLNIQDENFEVCLYIHRQQKL